jgi:GcrA cell cycle regulator
MSAIKNKESAADHADGVPLKKRKTMNTLMPDDCRWPIGDPQSDDFHFCGARKQDGHPYCETHVRSASTPSRPRNISYRRDYS